MKKKSKVIGKDYEKLDLNNACDQFDFYGLILRDDRVKVDTKRNNLLLHPQIVLFPQKE